MAGGNLLEISDGTFDGLVLQSDVPVLVDFWAPWCGPCRMVTPFMEQLADEYAGQVKVGKVNVDESQQTAVQYRISSIPVVMLFKNGEKVDEIIGANPKANYKSMIDRHL